MGRLPRELEAKRLRLVGAAQRAAFESYIRRGRVPETYVRIADLLRKAKSLGDSASSPTPAASRLPSGRPTTHYTWRTAGDHKVRAAHAALNGHVFSWANPPDYGHPGSQPNCRCWPEPYYGDPAVPDSELLLSRSRRLGAGGELWTSIETVNRPDGSLAASTIVANDGTRIDSTFVGTGTTQVVALPKIGILQVERDGDIRRVSWGTSDRQSLRLAWLGRTTFPRFSVLPVAPTQPAAAPVLQLPNDRSPLDGVNHACRDHASGSGGALQYAGGRANGIGCRYLRFTRHGVRRMGLYRQRT